MNDSIAYRINKYVQLFILNYPVQNIWELCKITGS